MTTEEQALNTIYRRARLRFALAKMNDDYERMAIVLLLMGWNQREIAEVYDVSKQVIQYYMKKFKSRNGLRAMTRGHRQE